MPSVLLSEEAGDQRRNEAAEVDHAAIDLERHAATTVLRRIEFADLRRNVAPHEPGPEDQQQQGQQEGLVEGHGEMAAGHQQRAEDHPPSPPEPSVADEPAEHGRQGDKTDVETENLGRQRLRRHRADDRFQAGAEFRKAGDALHMTGQQQLLDHVQHQQ